MKAIILAIGNELTTGQSVDTNSAYLAQKLGERGIETIEHVTLPDDTPAIAAGLDRAGRLADIVIATGGLGPTQDDLTRQALADALGTTLELHEESLHEIEAFFAQIHRPMADVNRVQAMVPRGAEPMANSCGTAPGLHARLHDADIFITPGVPSEMRAMFDEHIAPRLPRPDRAIVHRIVRLFGLGESTVAERFADLITREGPVLVGTTVDSGLVSVRITASANTEPQAEALAQARVDALCERAGEHVVSTEEAIRLPEAVARRLTAAGQTMATAESCTGGLIGQLLTDVPGASTWYLGGVVAYANTVKESLLNVPADLLAEHGAVSEPVAKAMADGARAALGADWAVATTGIAGPTGGTPEKPVGLVYIAVAGPAGVEVRGNHLHGSRERIRARAAQVALDMLRRALG